MNNGVSRKKTKFCEPVKVKGEELAVSVAEDNCEDCADNCEPLVIVQRDDQPSNDVVGTGKARQGYCSGNCNLSQSITVKGGNRQWVSIELF